MNKYYIIALIIVIIGGGIWYFSSPKQHEVKNYPSQGTDIIAFGDSLVFGVGATKPENNFVARLSAKIGQPIVYLGVSGNTTADGLARLNELDKYKPKIVILLLGGNDYLRQTPEQTTFSNLGKIIEDIQGRGAMVLVLGVKGSLFGDGYKKEFEALSQKYQTAYVSNVLDGLFGNNTYMADALHPNDLGYEKIANKVYQVLSHLLQHLL